MTRSLLILLLLAITPFASRLRPAYTGVRERFPAPPAASTLTLADAAATLKSDREATATRYALGGMEEFRKLNRGTLTLTGTGTENGKPVDGRIVLTLRRNLFTWRKETRTQDRSTDFAFRDGYTLTREKPPSL